MSAQTSYSITQDVAYAGLIYAQSPHDISSRLVEPISGIEFGIVVRRGSNPETQIDIGTPLGQDVFGITIRSLDKEGAANTGAIKWNVTESAAVLRAGYVWVVCNTSCVAGDQVKFDNATGEFSDATLFPPGIGESFLQNSVWDTSTTAGGLAVIRKGWQ